jgi:hypothetical protein
MSDRPKMSDFESKIIWRFIAPLALACIMSAAGSVVTVVRLSVIVDSLTAAQQKTASRQWVASQIKLINYQIDGAQADIKTNARRIERTRALIHRYHPLTGVLALPGLSSDPDAGTLARGLTQPPKDAS